MNTCKRGRSATRRLSSEKTGIPNTMLVTEDKVDRSRKRCFSTRNSTTTASKKERRRTKDINGHCRKHDVFEERKHAVDLVRRERVLSQAIAFSSAKCKADRPPKNWVSGQSFTMCDILCEVAPQKQDGSETWFQRTRLAAYRFWPVRKWFNVDHKHWRRSNPGGAMEGSTISERFTTSQFSSSPLFSPFLSWWHLFLLWFLEPYWTSWCKADFRTGLRLLRHYRTTNAIRRRQL